MLRRSLKVSIFSEIYAAAKETVALAEQRFMSNSHEWQFDNAWQEMLNHATIKVMDAESQKTESGLEHQKKALVFNMAELKVQQLEEKLKRFIHKSRPYFEENQICQDQLKTQKERIKELQTMIQAAKSKYAKSLRNLEEISEEIHRQRGDLPVPPGPREPGVGAELSPDPMDEQRQMFKQKLNQMPDYCGEFDRLDELPPFGSSTIATSTAVSDKDEGESDAEEMGLDDNDADLEELRKKVKVLAIRPINIEGGEGQQDVWESELNATVDKLDHLMMLREFNKSNQSFPATPTHHKPSSVQPETSSCSPKPPIKMLRGGGELPTSNSSLNELSVAKLLPYVLPFSATDLAYSKKSSIAEHKPTAAAVTKVGRKMSI